MKKVLKIVKAVVIIIILFAVIGLFLITRGLKEGKALVIRDVNLSVLQDGKYHGVYHKGRWLSEVNVIIKDHKIMQVQLVSDPMLNPGSPDFSKELFKRVIEKQTPNVEVVSGATVTSKAYLKSIEYALTK
ncbi:MAG: hypothetical protein K0S71_1822 [Clostridia bacterium]|jgi:uncharacterized protein with FMN-binding domain|nr:hypothetical protein [Clostridia bacterium]